jgi:O-antigen/teichoic acid export membrane protein
MSDPAFIEAYKIAPIIILAYLFQAWSKFCNLGILIEKKTIYIAYAEVYAAIVITVAYFTLIPVFGIFGAAWATVIGFYFRFYWTNKKSNQFYNMQLPWGKVLQSLGLATVAFMISLFIPEDILISVIMRFLLLVIFIVIFFTLPILDKPDKRLIANTLTNYLRTLKSYIIH